MLKHLHLHWKYWKKKMSIQVYLIKTQALMYQWYAFILFSEMDIDNDNLSRVYEFKRQISSKIFRQKCIIVEYCLIVIDRFMILVKFRGAIK